MDPSGGPVERAGVARGLDDGFDEHGRGVVALGIIGQTIAGLLSLTSLIMVWTALTLAYRRLAAPLLRRRRPRTAFGAGMADGARLIRAAS